MCQFVSLSLKFICAVTLCCSNDKKQLNFKGEREYKSKWIILGGNASSKKLNIFCINSLKWQGKRKKKNTLEIFFDIFNLGDYKFTPKDQIYTLLC